MARGLLAGAFRAAAFFFAGAFLAGAALLGGSLLRRRLLRRAPSWPGPSSPAPSWPAPSWREPSWPAPSSPARRSLPGANLVTSASSWSSRSSTRLASQLDLLGHLGLHGLGEAGRPSPCRVSSRLCTVASASERRTSPALTSFFTVDSACFLDISVNWTPARRGGVATCSWPSAHATGAGSRAEIESTTAARSASSMATRHVDRHAGAVTPVRTSANGHPSVTANAPSVSSRSPTTSSRSAGIAVEEHVATAAAIGACGLPAITGDRPAAVRDRGEDRPAAGDRTVGRRVRGVVVGGDQPGAAAHGRGGDAHPLVVELAVEADHHRVDVARRPGRRRRPPPHRARRPPRRRPAPPHTSTRSPGSTSAAAATADVSTSPVAGMPMPPAPPPGRRRGPTSCW